MPSAMPFVSFARGGIVVYAGFSHTETCLRLLLVNGSRCLGRAGKGHFNACGASGAFGTDGELRRLAAPQPIRMACGVE